ncbi:MAG: IS1634 family transposase [Trueperaceae bacterium]|nr:IS1634 family transposase [Trueperaceae bacterium]
MSTPSYETRTIEHLGLVAGMVDELGIAELIDKLIAQDRTQRQVSIGQAVKAMILNGLGFANRRLYLTPHFFQNKPTERLIAPGIQAEHLHDDTLGKALDALHRFGVSELFTLISHQAMQRLGLSPKQAHLDTTSFHVDGRYNGDEDATEGVIRIAHGYSRDHRPDLKQVVLELITENSSGIPLLMAPLSGNQDDTATTLQALQHTNVTWVMSVPATLSSAKELLGNLTPDDFSPLVAGYEVARVEVTYAEVPQRWLIIRSQAARKRARAATERQLLKTSEAERKRFETLCRQEFSCEQDALGALERYQQSCRVLSVSEVSVDEQRHYGKAGRPAKEALPERVSYHLRGVLWARASLLEERLERASHFILATNDVTGERLSNVALLQTYKDQANVERGFRFLKDPMFLASTLFLKKAERIMALLMVMTLCLLVYAALEHRIRTTLARHSATLPDQKGKPTHRPTARWVFELFLDVHLLFITTNSVQVLVMNLKSELKQLLALLGPPYAEAYS